MEKLVVLFATTMMLGASVSPLRRPRRTTVNHGQLLCCDGEPWWQAVQGVYA